MQCNSVPKSLFKHIIGYILKRLNFYIKVLSGLHKSLLVNLKYFGLKGLILPILVSRRTRLRSVKGSVKLNKPFKPGMVMIGFSGVAMSTYHDWNLWNVNGEICFEGTANFGTGTRIYVGKEGKIIIGDNFLVTAKSEICCEKRVVIGNSVLFSWDILLMDTDSHPIRDRDLKTINEDKEIIIGNNVWIGCRCTILKGSIIPENSVVASNSLVNRRYENSGSLLGGIPAKVLQTGVVWKREHF